MPGAEAFTVLAVLEAQDRASAAFEKIDRSLEKFMSDAQRAASSAGLAGDKIDEGLLKTASGADALDLAAARVATAEEKLVAATTRQAEAEQALLAAREAVASQDELAASADKLAAAEQRATAAAEEFKAAKANVSALKAAEAGEEELAAAAAKLAEADAQATVAAKALAEAKARDAELTKPADVLAAADAITAAEKKTAAASKELSEAQAKQAAIQSAATGETEAAAAAAGGLSRGWGVAALGIAAAGGMAVKAAGDFQSSTQHLVTDAGESQKNLQMVQQGILNVATATGTSASALSDAMYHIESAGFHGSAGLTLLKTAAEGAKVGGADFETVAKTLTGTMNAYNMTGDQATQMMNALIATVGAGDMRMQDLASSLGNVAPLAAAAGISFDQVGGAIATMTGQNMSAQQATQDLANTIRSLSNPNKQAIDEMQALGLDSNDLANNLGKRGLTGTLEMLTTAIAQHTQGGQVFIDTLKQSKNAAADARTMIGQLPAALQTAAEKFLDGKTTVKDFNDAIKDLPPQQEHLAKQFEGLVEKTGSFNQLLTSGSPSAQTMNAALAKLLGGSTGLNTALMLTGGRMQTFKDSTQTVADALHKGGNEVDNWDKIQGTFNQQLDRAKSAVEAAGIKIGTIMLPAVQKVATALADGVSWLAQHKTAIEGIAVVIGGVLVGAVIALGTAMATAMGPEILIATGLIALGAALYEAYQHSRTFRTIVDALGRLMSGAFKQAIHDAGAVIDWLRKDVLPEVTKVIKDVFAWFDQHKEDFTDAWDKAVKTIHSAVKWFDDNVLKWVRARIDELIKWWHDHSKEITEVWDAVWAAVKIATRVWWDGFMKPTLLIIEETWRVVWGSIKDTLQLAWDLIAGIVEAGIHWIENIIGLILDVITGNWGKVWGDLSHMVNQALDDVVNVLGGLASDFGDLLWDAGVNLIHGLIGGIRAAAGGVGAAVSDIVQGIKDFFHWSPAKRGPLVGSGSMDNAGRNIARMLAFGMNDSTSVVQHAAGQLAAAISIPLNPGAGTRLAAGSSLPGLGLSAVAAPAAGPTIVIDVHDNRLLDGNDINQLASRVGQHVTQQLAAAGVRIRG